MVSIAEVAGRLNIPASTGREYVKRFQPFFPTTKVAGSRFPKYPDTALEIMRDIVEGYKKQLSRDELFDLLQQKYPLDAELLARQQRQAQNVSNPNDDVMITTPPTSQTSLDIYMKMQATQFQVLQQMTQVLENNNKLMERLIGLLEKPQSLSKSHAGIKSPHKQSQKSRSKKSKQPQKKGFLSFLRGK
jgi:hypothetical protein